MNLLPNRLYMKCQVLFSLLNNKINFRIFTANVLSASRVNIPFPQDFSEPSCGKYMLTTKRLIAKKPRTPPRHRPTADPDYICVEIQVHNPVNTQCHNNMVTMSENRGGSLDCCSKNRVLITLHRFSGIQSLFFDACYG